MRLRGWGLSLCPSPARRGGRKKEIGALRAAFPDVTSSGVSGLPNEGSCDPAGSGLRAPSPGFSRYLVQGKTRTGNGVAMETREALPDRGKTNRLGLDLTPAKPVASPPRLRGPPPRFHCKRPVAAPPGPSAWGTPRPP